MFCQVGLMSLDLNLFCLRGIVKQQLAPVATQLIDCQVADNREQPGSKAPPLDVILARLAPDPPERILKYLLGLIAILHDPEREAERARGVAFVERFEGVHVLLLHACQQLVVRFLRKMLRLFLFGITSIPKSPRKSY